MVETARLPGGTGATVPGSHLTARMDRRQGYTILELIVTVSVIALLLGLLLPALKSARRSSGGVRELAAARQLMMAYSNYAYGNGSRLMPGYYEKDDVPARNEAGEDLRDRPLGEVTAARYPWRLAPYLGYDMDGLYLDENLRSALAAGIGPVDEEYLLSLYPSMGLNSFFVGGDSDHLAFREDNVRAYGQFYLTRVSSARHPTRLITFASARVSGETAEADLKTSTVEGHFRLEPPCFTETNWTSYKRDCQTDGCAKEFGYVSLRHDRKAAIGFFDCHTGLLDEAQIRDMRFWADDADRSDWKLRQK